MCDLPPQLLAETVEFAPRVGAKADRVLTMVSTWMTGHAKIAVTYEKPFWGATGLSGDVISHQGPMVGGHDASPMDRSCGSFFGFIGTPAKLWTLQVQKLQDDAVAQLIALFGDEAAEPFAISYVDWTTETETATTANQVVLSQHRPNGYSVSLTSRKEFFVMNRRLTLAHPQKTCC